MSIKKTFSVRTRCQQHEHGGRPRRQDQFLSTPWQLLVALVALLDFLSTLANQRLFIHGGSVNGGGDEELIGAHLRIFGQNFTLPHQFVTKIFVWLDAYSVHFGFLFSVLWCIEAFMVAERDAYKALREWDRREHLRLLRTALNDDSSRKSCIHSSPEYQSTEYERFKTYSVYWASLILQFLKLPVGFYLIIIQFARMKTSSTDAAGALVSPEDMRAILQSTYEYVDLPNEYRTFSNETKLSLGFAIAKHSGKTVYEAANSRMKREIWKAGWLEGRRLGWNFVRHPIRSFQNTRWILYWTRWILYLLPLLQGLFKMRTNFKELILTCKQSRQRMIARRKRRQEWMRMNEMQQKNRAAETIQSTYRSYKQRQACMELIMSRREMDDHAARRLQFALRVLCERAKAKEEQKKAELAKLEARHKNTLRTARRDTIMMAPKDRARLGRLRNQFRNLRTRSIDRRLLMQPNSKLQIFWKSLFVCVVLLEMIVYGLDQRLAKQQSSVAEVIQNSLIPIRVIDRKECYCLARAKGDSLKWEKLQSKKRMKCNLEPWYCTPFYLHLQSIYTDIILFLKYRFIGLGALVLLLDVPVAFYTGDIHPDTGVLVPKDFFQRWPNVIIQLLINPQFETASKLVFKLWKNAYQIGPIRVFRWCRALFYPAAVLFFDFMEWSVWMPIVTFSNRKPPPIPEEQQFAPRRSFIDPQRQSIFTPMISPGNVPVPSRLSFASSRGSSITLAARFAVDDSYNLTTAGKKFR